MIDDKDLSDLYRLGAVEKPPESLDQKILHQAHMATLRHSRWRRWQWPASAAASVMLCTTLYMLYTDKSEFDLLAPPMSESSSLPASSEKMQAPVRISADVDLKESDEPQAELFNEEESASAPAKMKAERKARSSASKASAAKTQKNKAKQRQEESRMMQLAPAPASSPAASRELQALDAAQERSVADEVAVPEAQLLQGMGATKGQAEIRIPKQRKKIHPQYNPETGKVTPHHLLKEKQNILSAEQYIVAIKKALAEGDKDQAQQLLQELQTHYPEKWGQSKLKEFEQ